LKYNIWWQKFFSTFQEIKLPGLSMTKVIFHNFPSAGILKKKSRTFQEMWEL